MLEQAIQVSNKNEFFIGLSEEMFDEGYQNITNIDISHVVTKAM